MSNPGAPSRLPYRGLLMNRFVRAWMILALAARAGGLGAPIQPTTPTQPSPTQPAPTEVAGPAEAIWIQTPGNGSRLVGQVHVQGEAEPTLEQTLVVQVVALDEEPFQVLAQETVIIGADVGLRGAFAAEIGRAHV